jgi:hypothetical protein
MPFADIVPVLSAVTRIPESEMNAAFVAAWDEAKAMNGGRADSRTFIEAVGLISQEVPFSLSELSSAWKAKDALDRFPASAKAPVYLMT